MKIGDIFFAVVKNNQIWSLWNKKKDKYFFMYLNQLVLFYVALFYFHFYFILFSTFAFVP